MKLKYFLFLFLIGSPFLFVLYSLDGVISPSHDAGIYSDDFELSFTAISDIDIYYHFEESMDKNDVKYIFPLSLTAMSGESRKYCLVITALDENEIIETRTIEYIIDKDIPNPPVLNKRDGLYNNSITMKFIKNEADIYYSTKSSGKNISSHLFDYLLYQCPVIAHLCLQSGKLRVHRAAAAEHHRRQRYGYYQVPYQQCLVHGSPPPEKY